MPPRPPLPWGTIPSLFLLPPSLRSIPCQSQRRTIRSILKPPPKPSRFDQSAKKVPAALSVSAALTRKTYTLRSRTGVLATKKGMTAVYDAETGARTPCTVLQLDRCQVVAHKTKQKHGYFAVQVGHGYRHPDNITRPMLGHYRGAKVSPKKKLVEFRVRGPEGLPPVGAELKASWFVVGQYIDAKSQNRGMGFAGGMKKHGWSGQPASHGNSLTHRAMGSAGGSQGSGSRVHPGKAMAGRMGGEQHTVQNLKVLRVDEENGIVVVKGCVSGPKKCLVKLQDAVKKPWQIIDLSLPTLPISKLTETTV